MLRSTITAATALVFLVPATSLAKGMDGPYVSLQAAWNQPLKEGWKFGGGNELEPDFDSSGAGSVALGYDWGVIRGELEYGYRDNSAETMDFNVAGGGGSLLSPRVITDGGPGRNVAARGVASYETLLFNVFYDWNEGGRWQPYVGIGLGGGRLDLANVGARTTNVDGHDSNFAYQGMFGLAAQIFNRAALELRYTILGIDDSRFVTDAGESFSTDAFTHSVGLVIRVYTGSGQE